MAKEIRKHELGTVADGVDGAVIHDHTLVASEERLEGRDDSVDRRAGCRRSLGGKNVVKGGYAALPVHSTSGHGGAPACDRRHREETQNGIFEGRSQAKTCRIARIVRRSVARRPGIGIPGPNTQCPTPNNESPTPICSTQYETLNIQHPKTQHPACGILLQWGVFGVILGVLSKGSAPRCHNAMDGAQESGHRGFAVPLSMVLRIMLKSSPSRRPKRVVRCILCPAQCSKELLLGAQVVVADSRSSGVTDL